MLRLRLKEVLKEKQVSRTSLFHLSEVSYTTIRSMCKDPYYSTSIETINRLAEALNIPVTLLIEDVSAEYAANEQARIGRSKPSAD